MVLRQVGSILCLGSVLSAPGYADTGGPWSVRFVAENDSFTSGTDVYYSNGLQLGVQGPDSFTGSSLDFLFDWAWRGPAGAAETVRSFEFSLAQNIYTPTRKSLTDFDPDDRPYSAWTRIDASLRRGYWGQGSDLVVRQGYGVSFGDLGSAGGEEVQNGWHFLFDIPPWEGWKNHIADRPAVQGHFDYSLDWFPWQSSAVTPKVLGLTVGNELQVGNVFVRDSLLAAIQIGYFRSQAMAWNGINPVNESTWKDHVAYWFSKLEVYGYLRVRQNITMFNGTLDHAGTNVTNEVSSTAITMGPEISIPLWWNLEEAVPAWFLRASYPYWLWSVQSPDFDSPAHPSSNAVFWRSVLTGRWNDPSVFHSYGRLVVELNWQP